MVLQAYPSSTRTLHVDSLGTLTAGPVSWSAELTSKGHYTVHHDIGSEDYLVIAQVLVTPDQPSAVVVVTEEKPDYLCFRVSKMDGTDYNHDVQLAVFA